MGMFDEIIVPKSYLRGILDKKDENLFDTHHKFQTKDLSSEPAIAQKIMNMVDTDDNNILASQIKDLEQKLLPLLKKEYLKTRSAKDIEMPNIVEIQNNKNKDLQSIRGRVGNLKNNETSDYKIIKQVTSNL